MERLQAGEALDADAYEVEARNARALSGLFLRKRYRQLRRHAPLGRSDLARLRAINDELAARGLEPPS